MGGTASALGPVRVVQSSGAAAASSSAELARATATGRRITPRASRYQPSEPSETAGPRRIESASMRVPSSAQQRGDDEDRDHRGEHRDRGAGDGHRVEEALRHEDQRRHRRGDGEAGEERGAPGGLHGAAVRLARRAAAADLLAVARDHQQRVVDREAEAEPGGDVEREERGVDEARHDPQHEERADDRDAADQQRDRGGDDAAEDEEEQQGQQREGDQLRLGQVLAGLVVGLVEAVREAALGDVERAGVGQRLDPFGGDPAGVLDVVGREVAGDRQRLPVFGDQLGAGPRARAGG